MYMLTALLQLSVGHFCINRGQSCGFNFWTDYSRDASGHRDIWPPSVPSGNMMEVAGPWTEVFEGSERTETSGGADTLLGSSTLTLAPLVADSPSIPRSQPILITSNRYNQQEAATPAHRAWLTRSGLESIDFLRKWWMLTQQWLKLRSEVIWRVMKWRVSVKTTTVPETPPSRHK